MRKTGSPEVSVIIPVYNGAAFLPEAIESIRSQCHPALEILVIDDGAEMDFSDLIPDEEGIRLIRQDHWGVSAARNRGIREAQGDFVAFLDVDDLWPGGALSALLEPFRTEPSTDVSAGKLQLVVRKTEDCWEHSGAPFFSCSLVAALFRKTVFRKTGFLDETLSRGEDTDFIIRVIQTGHLVAKVDTTVLLYRIHGGNTTGTVTTWKEGLMAALRKSIARRKKERINGNDA
jgi:glycosyltransferase involved in cell wall biosynthesis